MAHFGVPMKTAGPQFVWTGEELRCPTMANFNPRCMAWLRHCGVPLWRTSIVAMRGR